MTQQDSALRRRLIIAGPSAAIAVLYLLLIQLPSQREYKQHSVKLNKLTAAASRIDFQAESNKLASMRQETTTLNERLNSNQQFHSQLVAKGGLHGISWTGGAPAAALAELLGLLERRGLSCASTLPVMTRDAKSSDDRTNGPMASESHELQLTLKGTFQAMRTALDELKSGSIAIQVVSLEMAEVERSLERSWTLTVALGGNAQ